MFSLFHSRKGLDGREKGSYLTRTALLVLHVRHDALQSVLSGLWVVGTSIFKVGDALPLLEDGFWSQLLVNWEAVSTRSLPAGLSDPAATDFVKVASSWLGNLVGAKCYDKWRYVVWLESLNHLLWKNGSGHGGSGVWRNGVDQDVVLGSLTGKGT